ncbi:MAG: tRNA preQ1(34) S-adenosylmethionine ribosyltransferase-isomerase QueA [Bacteroidetes bacterium 4572_128]|nr:MAG: tRNA preQ1(34) S-adenosylmethionine ribosyltransferase-isomerase QueA [Bacteroidetes bacterium 4572_128]
MKTISTKLSKFRYVLPEGLIASKPKRNRDESRLMVIHKDTKKIEHKVFKDVIDYFEEDDMMVFNNTRVFPALLKGFKEKTGARIEVILLRELNAEQCLWDVLVNPARKIRIGNKLFFGESGSLIAEVIDNTTSRGRTLRFLYDGSYIELKKILYKLGETLLPNTIKREAVNEDVERYQTVYAKETGAVAAPTAGMHFSKILLKRLEIKGIEHAEVTLHAGLGNFRSVNVEDLSKHKMDSEQIRISKESADLINKVKKNKKRVCAVGTTVMKTLESSVTTIGNLKEFDGWTNKFIFPPYKFKIANAMISNFHMPASTLLMMVSAFAGYEFLKEAYDLAIREKYRFGTYGDAILVL